MNTFLLLIICLIIFVASLFEGWLLIEFRKKIGNLKLFLLVVFCVFVISFLAYLLAR